MSSFSFVLTEKCEWKCKYCIFPSMNQKEPSLSVYERHLPYIKRIMDMLACHDILVNVDIQGGEVGSIPIEILRYFFQTIGHPIAVSTNGEFMRRGYHLDPIIRENLSMVMWHVTDDFNSYVQEDFNDDEIFISKGIVHDNLDEILGFIRRNSHIVFDYVEFEFDIDEVRDMKKSMYETLLDELHQFDNVTQNALDTIEGRINERGVHREQCKNFNGSVLIDLVNEKICICQRQMDDCIDLNRANLIKRLVSFPRALFEGKDSNKSTRLYYGKYQGRVIERYFKARSICYED